MKINNIKSIRNYKSFADFEWSKFCIRQEKDKIKQTVVSKEEKFSNFNIIFGENGSGKSSVCEILKNLSQNQLYPDITPDLVEVEISSNKLNSIYRYENRTWAPKQLDNNSILFFDLNFINSNVHTHGDRSNQQGKHSQNLGKIIISLDEKANNLKSEVKINKDELEIFDNSNNVLLKKTFSENEIEFFERYKIMEKDEISDNLQKITELKDKINTDIVALQKVKLMQSEVKNIHIINLFDVNTSISGIDIYSELLSRKIKDKSDLKVSDEILKHFEVHKHLVEVAKGYLQPDIQNQKCPLCMQPLSNSVEVIEYYKSVFDKTYELEKDTYIFDIQTKLLELTDLKNSVQTFLRLTSSTFEYLEKLKSDFEIDNIYDLEEKNKFTGFINTFSLKGVDNLISTIEACKQLNKDSLNLEITDDYELVVHTLGELNIFVSKLNQYISSKNKLIELFVDKYLDLSSVESDLNLKSKQLEKINDEIKFIQNDLVNTIKNKIDIDSKHKLIQEKLKSSHDNLEDYLSSAIPSRVIDSMRDILLQFNLQFTIEHIKPAPNTKDYSFSFKIKDRNGNERNFKDGLSDGERQLISIAFFIAINEKVIDKKNTILVFDDPITSLDSPNLNILSNLIYNMTSEFSQIFVFTHHPLFYKYLSKCPNPSKFGILNNKQEFGGSFIYCESNFDLIEEVKKCEEEINSKATLGELNPQEIAYKYGQLLRLSVEKFIKNDLLLWDKEGDFENRIIENLSTSKSKIQQLNQDDLDVLVKIHRYCNHSNLLHADKESPSTLSELMNQIKKFVNILDKVS